MYTLMTRDEYLRRANHYSKISALLQEALTFETAPDARAVLKHQLQIWNGIVLAHFKQALLSGD